MWKLWNSCKYDGCPESFATLHELIVHVESHHLNFDEKFMEEFERDKPQYVPMSYVLKYSDEVMPPTQIRDEFLDDCSNTTIQSDSYTSADDIKEELEINVTDVPEDFYNAKQNYFMPESPPAKAEDSQHLCVFSRSKKFMCAIPGCLKRYKNRNGMKYHIVNYHNHGTQATSTNQVVKPKKEFNCHCGKQYKTIRGLQSHFLTHNTPPLANGPRIVPKYDGCNYKPNCTSLFPRSYVGTPRPFSNFFQHKANCEKGKNYNVNADPAYKAYGPVTDGNNNNNRMFKRL